MATYPISVNSISGVSPLDNNYLFTVEIQDSGGVPITRPGLTNPQTIHKTSLSTPFVIPFSFPDSNYDLQNHKTVVTLRGQQLASINGDILVACAACQTSPSFAGGPSNHIDSVTNIGLQFYWYGVNVTILQWEIYDGDNVLSDTLVRSGTVRPVSGNTVITFASLADGTYYLRIKGYSCISSWTGLEEFTIGEVPVIDSSAGMRIATEAGKDFQWHNSRNVSIIVQNDGTIKLDCPSTRPTITGGSTGNRYIFYNHHIPVQGQFLTDLLGDGVDLPRGSYTFTVMWSTAPNITDLINNFWPAQYDTNAKGAQVEYVYIGII